jgi:hypothetical protein
MCKTRVLPQQELLVSCSNIQVHDHELASVIWQGKQTCFKDLKVVLMETSEKIGPPWVIGLQIIRLTKL